jgi:nucleoside-diphosphate-sugar epimerase
LFDSQRLITIQFRVSIKLDTLLLTGSSGFIGSNLVSSINSNYKIFGISNKKQTNKIKNFFHQKKDLNVEDIKIRSSFSTIVHLAALSDVKYCELNPSICVNVNVLGTKKMLEICRKKDSNFIFTSTSHVYGSPKKIPITEDERVKPTNIYATSKIMAENLCESYAKTYGLNIAVLRLFSVYGPNSPQHNVVHSIMNQYMTKQVINLGNLKSKRDFIYIDDVIDAIKIIIKKQKGYEVFNVGCGKSTSIKSICDNISKISKRKPKINLIKNKLRKNDIKEIKCSYSKINKIHNWKPKYDLNLGLQSMYNQLISKVN